MGKRTGGTTPSLGTNRFAAGALATVLVLAASSAAACGDAERAAHSAADSGVVVAAASSSRGDAAARTVTADAFSTTSENVQPPHGRAAPLTASASSQVPDHRLGLTDETRVTGVGDWCEVSAGTLHSEQAGPVGGHPACRDEVAQPGRSAASGGPSRRPARKALLETIVRLVCRDGSAASRCQACGGPRAR